MLARKTRSPGSGSAPAAMSIVSIIVATPPYMSLMAPP